MKIDKKLYSLPDDSYLKFETIKKQIVIGHTGTNKMRHIEKWKNRLNGKYKKTAAFTIDTNGKVYRHFDPIYFSEILGDIELDKKSIVILLENDGWLTKNVEKNEFINWVGHIYNKPEDIVERRWRNYSYWAPYSDEQFTSAVKLVSNICEEFFIPKFAVPHNTKIEDLEKFNGVLYKSNLEKYYTDLSPAWDFEKFKYKLEQDEK
jgi:hypothetical protein